MALTPALRTRIETLLQGHRAVLFMKGSPTTPQCGFSAKAVAALETVGIDYATVNVLEDGEIREGIKAYGDWPTIPQLYVDGELVGGSDIIEQMVGGGELHSLFGLAPPDRTPPSISITPAAREMIGKAVADAGGDYVLQVEIDSHFRTRLQLAPRSPSAIIARADGIDVQFDLAGARRADGMTIDFADDIRGRGLVIDNPNAPDPVQDISPADADARLAAGTLTLVDVRPPDERASASVARAFEVLDGDAITRLQQLPRHTPLAFLCHHGGRSQQAAEHFRNQGFTHVYNVAGGIDAWSEHVDDGVPKY